MLWSSLLALSLRMPRDGTNSPGPPGRCGEQIVTSTGREHDRKRPHPSPTRVSRLP